MGSAFAQTSSSSTPATRPVGDAVTDPAALPPDMRLWSFGDCNRQFPATDSKPYKDCARIVGSEEARDARAEHYCKASHERDRAGADKCVQSYRDNKRLLKDAGQPGLTQEMVQRVKTIAALGAEVDRIAQAESNGTSEAAPAQAGANAVEAMPDVAPVTLPRTPAASSDTGSASWSLFGAVGFLVLAVLLMTFKMRGARRKSPSAMQY